ncbi:ABC transporter family substrate-binding protein [Olsenella phocaeensis]|uniref:ABC transporter family substrate-binding protein n=1 Tax=Olsenella phocaeensis TaxID=1852385 RepID=UPI000930E343|nr:ABC transporter family substrate-binding protein [Olsenella phocaeensis]
MISNIVSRRSFVGMAGAAAALAGLGLAGCGGSGNSGSGSAGADTGVEPQNGSPATTPIDQLPLPEKGKTYDNPLSRDKVKDGGTLVLPVTEVGPDFNYFSVNGNTVYINWFWYFYMPTLFTVDATASAFTPNPNFVASASADMVDGKQVATITLADKANFNDGTPIDWRSIEAVWKCCSGADENYTPSSTDGFVQVESVVKGETDKQAVITFSQPYYPWQNLFQRVLHPSAATVDAFNNGWVNNPHNEWAAGPFVVDSSDETQITFKRNEKWWGDEAKLETVTFKQMESQAMFNAFKNGEIDATELGASGTGEMLSNFVGMENTEIRRADSKSIAVIEVNSTREGLKDEAVRKAFMQCINTETIVGIVYQGVNWKEDRMGSLVIAPWMDGYENNLPEDVAANTTAEAQAEAAKKTLEATGYEMGSDGYYAKDGKQVTFSFTAIGDSNVVKNRAAAIQKMAKDAGMNLTIDNKPSSEFSKTLTGGEWDTILFGWSSSSASYNNGGQIFGSQSSSNFTHCGNAELDAKFLAVTGIADHAEQMKAFNAAEKEALKSYAFIPLFAGADAIACKAGLANWGPALLKDIVAENVGWAKE